MGGRVTASFLWCLAVIACRVRQLCHAGVLTFLAMPAIALTVLDKQPVATVGDVAFRTCLLEGEPRQRIVQCATLAVPENEADPSSKTIELLIVRLPTSGAQSTGDPLVALAGGPGQSASESFLWMDRWLSDVASTRDIYLIDQRGTGHSNPQRCDLAGVDAMTGDDPEQWRALGSACLEQFEGDPRFYLSEVAVRDLERVRRALNLPQWNVYGVSYGTRVAQLYMRHFPGALRTVVLDGVLPLPVALGPEIAVFSDAALKALLAQCEEDPSCHERFPELASGIVGLFQQLSGAPVMVRFESLKTGGWQEMRFERAHLTGVIRMALYNSHLLSVLPQALEAAYRNEDFTVLARLSAELDWSDQMAMGMHNSIVCSEDVPFYADASTEPLNDTYMGETLVQGMKALCDVWPRGKVSSGFKAPLVSSVPTLLLSGERDPITPPAYGDQVKEGLNQSRHLVVPARAHHVGPSGCVPRLIGQFVESADVDSIRADCLQRTQPVPLFFHRNGPSP